MPSIVIDNRQVEVPEGSTVLDAARQLGLDIPTLCFAKEYRPSTSCMLCLVKLKGVDRFVPSCATVVQDGMQVESETKEVRQVRRTGLELLLSDHAGDCAAPCQNTCPCHMDIPLMLRQVAEGELADAIVTIKRDIALPAVLGRVCPELCERTCRRSEVDNPAMICQVKRFAADVDLASESPYLPPRQPRTSKKIAIIGTGPTGLSAAFHMLQSGHDCTLFDQNKEPGGMLRYDTDEDLLPRNVLDDEIAVIERLGAVFELETEIGASKTLSNLTDDFDAVLLATGPFDQQNADGLGLETSAGRLLVDVKTHETPTAGVFAAGDLIKPGKLVVRCVADGKDAALNIDQFLCGTAPVGRKKDFTIRLSKLTPEEIAMQAIGASTADRMEATDGLTAQQAKAESERCLHCDCGQNRQCNLQRYAQMYGANPNRYQGTRRVFERKVLPAGHNANVYFEPSKCILCGLCVQVATEASEPLGLTFVGRGFDVRVGVPFDREIADGLTMAANRCVEICPTGALTLQPIGTGGSCSCFGCDLHQGQPDCPGSIAQ